MNYDCQLQSLVNHRHKSTEIEGVIGGNSAVYGIIHDPSQSSTACQKVVLNGTQLTNVDSFAEIPAHGFRNCAMSSLANRTINYYTAQNDEGRIGDVVNTTGSFSAGGIADRTGGDGDIMTEIMPVYKKTAKLSDGRTLILVSASSFTGGHPFNFFYVGPGGNVLRKQYVGAYKSTICNASGTRLNLDEHAASSAAFATGYKARSVAGAKPWTSMTQAAHRTAAANNGGYGCNALYYEFLYTMMAIEFGNLDIQAAWCPGYSNASTLNYAFTRLSGRANFGNNSGWILGDYTTVISFVDSTSTTYTRSEVGDTGSAYCWVNGTTSVYTSSAAPSASDATYTTSALDTTTGNTVSSVTMRDGDIPWAAVSADKKVIETVWHGIHDPFCGIWEFMDGFVKDPTGYYMTADTSKYSDSTFATGYSHINHTWPSASGYVKTFDPETFLPTSIGGSSSTYMGDYFYRDDELTGYRCGLRGGRLNSGAGGGPGSVHVYDGLTVSYASFGARVSA